MNKSINQSNQIKCWDRLVTNKKLAQTRSRQIVMLLLLLLLLLLSFYCVIGKTRPPSPPRWLCLPSLKAILNYPQSPANRTYEFRIRN